MGHYPMTDVIAERDYEYERDGQRGPFRVQLGKPAPTPDTPHPAWYCPWAITEGHGETREFAAVGEDSMQALIHAFSGLRADLGRVARKGKLIFMDGLEGPHLDLV